MNNNSVRLLLTKTFLKNKNKNFSTNAEENKNLEWTDKNRKEILIGRLLFIVYETDSYNHILTSSHAQIISSASIHDKATDICCRYSAWLQS